MISNNTIVYRKKKFNAMKKIVAGMVVIAFMYIVYLVVYSGILPKINKDKIIGEWTGLGYTYVFAANGQFSGEWHEDSGTEDTSSFRCGGFYKIMGNTLTLYNTVLNIDIFPNDTSGDGENVEFIRQWLDEGIYDIRWKYNLHFTKGILQMDGINIDESSQLIKK